VFVPIPSSGETRTPNGDIKALPRQANAIRETYEEAGLKVEITGFLADSSRSLTYTRYYMARRVDGTPADMGWERLAAGKTKAGRFHGPLRVGSRLAPETV